MGHLTSFILMNTFYKGGYYADVVEVFDIYIGNIKPSFGSQSKQESFTFRLKTQQQTISFGQLRLVAVALLKQVLFYNFNQFNIFY